MKYNVAGIEQLSLTDWPGHVAAVLFTRGCNFRCPWCHNKALVYPELFAPLLPEDEVERYKRVFGVGQQEVQEVLV